MRSAAGGQRSFDDLGTPLADVTFCVLDIETTGSDRGTDLITEIGMVKVRGGEFLGTLQSLVNPGRAIPPMITVLTGITESMVVPRSAHRGGAAVDDRVLGRRGGRRPQRRLRPRLHQRRAHRVAAIPEIDQPGRRHASARSTTDPRRGTRLPPRHVGIAVSARPSTLPPRPSTTRWPPPTCCTSCSSAPRVSACWASTT